MTSLRESPRRGRPPRISQGHIVEAAIHLGLDAFSMQGIAEHLGVTPPALYTHVSGRDEVLELVATDLIARLDLPESETADWREWLRQFGWEVRRHLSRAGAALRVDLTGLLAVEELELSEKGLQLLIDAGFSPADAGRALWLVFRLATTAGTGDDDSVTLPMAEARRLVEPGALPATDKAIEGVRDCTDVDTFDFDLRVVLAGLEDQLLRRGKAEASAPT